MKHLRAKLTAVAICGAAIGFGLYGHSGAANNRDTRGGQQTEVAAACARCGDGVCARSCENATTCPRDCGGTTSAR